tara:strand:+ start:8529 stop:9491 length:963 start_codon:yes stop_codon:yes gene_type:complete
MSIKTVGYISLERRIMNSDIHPLQKKRSFTRYEAWIDLLQLAEYDDNETLKRGQICHSNRYLGKRWKWDKMKVHRFFKKLEKDQRIEITIDTDTDTPSDTPSDTASDTPKTIVTILKYRDLQGLRKNNDTPSDTAPDTLPDTVSDTNNNDNKLNNRKINKYSVHFLEAWKIYPNKNGKKKAEEKYRAALKKTDHQTILTALKQQIKHNWKETDSKYIPMFKTWLYGECWEDPIHKVLESNKKVEIKPRVFICDGCDKKIESEKDLSIYERFCECEGEFIPKWEYEHRKQQKNPLKVVQKSEKERSVDEMLETILQGTKIK